MKIAIDVTPWMPKPSGIGLYVSNLIQGLTALRSSEGFDLELVYQPGLKNWIKRNLSFPDYLQHYSNLRFYPFPVRVSNLFLEAPSLFSTQLNSFSENSDIVHGTNYTVFPVQKSRRVMTIYDISFVKYPEYANSTVKAYTNRLKKCLQWTDLVLTISQSSKQDIVEYLGFDPERIWVTHLASRYLLAPSKPESSQPYILFVSTIEPRKNLKSLISAFESLKRNYQIEHELILIGQKGWLYEPIFEQVARSPFRSSIRHLSYLSDDQVAEFYQNADVFVYPSHYEGFGMPVLEAMTLGAPVVTSNTSSLPEVAGDAAVLIDPNNVEQLSEEILRVIRDRQFRDSLIQKGKEQAKLFSWEKTAKETLNAYRSML
ncbi:glycosyltransferase family 4 protein [Leptolyngbya sp. NIES-2104]|uniref:glycosyltransferase family 4 protein n=1 Tax=Leptolyngbya sp. NIES-2104 TaxID=1552121 RepID=UPI0006EC5659|nr:glycosyltransferase family 1 protein [Leptolyngbya sp. NIES-2104]GAP96407.1 glycosyltransferase [Leptolyngbya sp. NIES-2104]